MSKPFAIVTDTGHNIPPDIVRDLQLQEVPFTINFGVQGSVDDGVLELGEFAALLDRYDKGAGYPTTSAPSPGRFADAFRRAFAPGLSSCLAGCGAAWIKRSSPSSRTCARRATWDASPSWRG
ncbi:MAG: DegV family protein [Chloroflexi bacterium]|nr:DegV family protein [Chloroflexota bacterium]